MKKQYQLSSAYVLLLHSFLLSLVSSSTNLTDQISLLAFRKLITSDPGDVLANNWTTKTSFCNWIGVTCSLRRARVRALDLRNMSLQGTVSPSIGNLSFLVSLDLSYNNFHGNLPHELGHLRRLREILMHHNQLEGIVPRQFNQLLQLQFLSLSFNSFNGGIQEEIGNLTKLKELYLTNNKLTGIIPHSLGNISTLEMIGCQENAIQGAIPPGLGNLFQLIQLDFDYNRLTGVIPPMVFNISTLKYIAFTANRLSGTIPISTGLRLPKLEGLYLPDNQLTGKIPTSISNASMLIDLELSQNLFSGEIPNNLGNLRQLQFLNLQNNRLQNDPNKFELDFLNSLVECQNLTFLIIGDNHLNGVLPSSIGNLSASVEMFNIDNAQIKGNIPVGIGNLSDMITLVLSNNELNGPIPSTIGQLNKLQRIYLQENRLQRSIPNELCYLDQLGELFLGESNISGSIPKCIGNMSHLSIISLEYNKLTSTIPSSFWNLKNLKFVNLSHNFVVNLAPEVGNLKDAEEIDLSWNEISSSIPETIGDLTSLRTLILSHNRFHGSIPRSFSNLKGLEFMDISSNALTGTIPSILQNLSFLESLNVSFNQLRGKIPAGGVFANLTDQSFMGNEGLCGISKFRLPPCAPDNTFKRKSVKMRVLKYVLPAVASAILLLCFLLWWIRSNASKKKLKKEPLELEPMEGLRMISYQEILRATNNFSESNLLGRGSFSSVYKGLLSDGTVSAVKVLDLQRDGAVKSFDIECKVIRSVRHRNLIKIISTCSNNEFRALILQYMPNRSLEYWLYSQDHYLNLHQRISAMLDVAMALDYLHNEYHEPVVHCDLKPSNILFDKDMVAHVGDFGIAKILAENSSATQTKTLGTIGYIAPEYGSEGRVSTSSDVYSYGIVLMEAFTRKRPTDDIFTESWSLRQWVSASYPHKVMEIVEANLLVTEGRWTERIQTCLSSITQIALKCSQDMPEERINMNEVVAGLKKIQDYGMKTLLNMHLRPQTGRLNTIGN